MNLLASCNAVVALPPGVRVARTFWERSRGLLGRASLRNCEGLILDPCNVVHTLGMRFPIDVVFLARADGGGTAYRVLAVRDAVAPWRPWVGRRRAQAVLELPAGAARRMGLRPGVRVLEPPEEKEG